MTIYLTPPQKRFKQLRQYLKLNQEEMAAKVRIKQAQVSQIETGARDISEAIYTLLEIHLSVNRTWLERGSGAMFMDELKASDVMEARKDMPIAGGRKKRNQELNELATRWSIFIKQDAISLEQLAFELGITIQTLRKYNDGQISIPTAAFIHLHRQYNMSYDWFLEGRGPRKINPDQKYITNISLPHLYDTQNMLISKLDYIQKQLAKEQAKTKTIQNQLKKMITEGFKNDE